MSEDTRAGDHSVPFVLLRSVLLRILLVVVLVLDPNDDYNDENEDNEGFSFVSWCHLFSRHSQTHVLNSLHLIQLTY
jgi:hypothetical protein